MAVLPPLAVRPPAARPSANRPLVLPPLVLPSLFLPPFFLSALDKGANRGLEARENWVAGEER